MNAHERIKVALIALFITFSLLGYLIYSISDYASINTIKLIFPLCVIGGIIVVYQIGVLVKDRETNYPELKRWTKENPRESMVLGFSSMGASVLVLLFFLWTFLESDSSFSSADDYKVFILGIFGAIVFFVIGILLLQVKSKKYPD